MSDLPEVSLPLVTIITPTFNRAHTIERTIDSVLKQTYTNIELVIIDDGSVDNTTEVLSKYNDSRIRLYRHQKNKGVTAAKNSGLDQIRGQWFTILDSDDEIVPEAIETMIKIPLLTDSSVTAVTCNCRDTTTNDYSGKGLFNDQYIDVKQIMTVCKGEFWGITRSSLLQNERFNENLRGFENILWYKIDDKAKRYYIHAALRIYHTEGQDRLMKSVYDFKKDVSFYENLVNESEFLNKVKIYKPDLYLSFCKNGVITMRAGNKKDIASKYYELSKNITNDTIINLSYKFKFISILLTKYKALKPLIQLSVPKRK